MPDETQIRDLTASPPTREWIPPIGALGGPPAHELYRELVVHAGLKVCRGPEGEPWVALKDGQHRRSFRVPSPELLSALDRFRMRRNLRPSPGGVIDEFTRIIQAHVSDPDAILPSLDQEEMEVPQTYARPTPDDVEVARGFTPWVDREERFVVEFPTSSIPSSISGGAMPPEEPVGSLPRYVRVLRDLIRNGSWMGTLAELSQRLQEDPETVFSNLTLYRSGLVATGIVIAPVEVEEGWRWLAVDRNRAEASGPESSTSDRIA